MKTRTQVFLVMAMIAALLATSSATAGGQEPIREEDVPSNTFFVTDEAPALGDYGRNGQIDRDKLPIGIRTLVSDRSIELANSRALSEARADWNMTIDFVDQVDYQLGFRSQFDFLKSDEAHLAQVLEAKPANFALHQLGLLMTEAEVRELQRRFALGDKMSEIVDAIGEQNQIQPSAESARVKGPIAIDGLVNDDLGEGVVEPGDEGLEKFSDNFGGIWMDQMNGGRILLAVKSSDGFDHARLNRIVGGDLVILDGQPSIDELETARTQLYKEAKTAGVIVDVVISSESTGRVLEVRTPDLGDIPRSFGSAVPKNVDVRVVKNAVFTDIGNPQDLHPWSELQPGLAIAVGNSACTWGFNGHTNNQTYIVGSGHCNPTNRQNYTGWTNTYEISQTYQVSPMPRIMTLPSSNHYLKSINNSTYDVFRASSGYANDNCYHGAGSGNGAHCEWPMTLRAWHNSWEINADTTCASLGTSNTYRCGLIREENQGGQRWVRASIAAQGGDSGSGAKFEYTIDGIITQSNGPEVLFNTAYDVQRQLGNGYFYFNCWPGEKTGAASVWGTCPGTNR